IVHLNKRLLKFFFVSNHIKKCSYAISLQGRRKSVRKSSIRAVTNDAYNKDYNINLWGDWSEKVDFYVDQYSIEVFWPKTGQVATFAKYSNDSGDNIVFDNLDNKSSSLVVQEMK
ncbi:MAG: hypothetical protein SOH50_04740, partial [Leuconostoc mesenteroides]